jgi:hypothetical protein
LASTKTPGLLPQAERASIIGEIADKQREDGGWSSSSLIPGAWKRKGATPQETKSDGYGTGLIAFVLEQAGAKAPLKKVSRQSDKFLIGQSRKFLLTADVLGDGTNRDEPRGTGLAGVVEAGPRRSGDATICI